MFDSQNQHSLQSLLVVLQPFLAYHENKAFQKLKKSAKIQGIRYCNLKSFGYTTYLYLVIFSVKDPYSLALASQPINLKSPSKLVWKKNVYKGSRLKFFLYWPPLIRSILLVSKHEIIPSMPINKRKISIFAYISSGRWWLHSPSLHSSSRK